MKNFQQYLKETNMVFTDQLQSLLQTRKQHDQFIRRAKEVEIKMRRQLTDIKSSCWKMEKKCCSFDEEVDGVRKNINSQLQSLKEKYASKIKTIHKKNRNSQTQAKPKSVIDHQRSLDDDSDIFRCGCGFKTSEKQQYVQHGDRRHFKRYFKTSSHYKTAFQNLIPFPCSYHQFQDPIDPTLYSQNIYSSNIQQNLLSPIATKKNIKSIKQTTNEKKEEKTQEMKGFITPNNKMTQPRNLIAKKQNVEKDESEIDNDQEEKLRCGLCQVEFPNKKLYQRHFILAHFGIVGPESSHIIVRVYSQQMGELKTALCFNIRKCPQEYIDRKFRCPCDFRKQYKYFDFIEHTLKWHKGMTPRMSKL